MRSRPTWRSSAASICWAWSRKRAPISGCSWDSSTRSSCRASTTPTCCARRSTRGTARSGEPEIDAYDFLQTIRAKARELGFDEALLARNVNEGFSGGERKRNEILQLAVLEPRLAVLDEIDSGLDIDALRQVAAGINRLRSPDRSFVLITHYRRLLDYVAADHVHVMVDGRIAASGDMSLVDQLEERGYEWVGDPQPALVE